MNLLRIKNLLTIIPVLVISITASGQKYQYNKLDIEDNSDYTSFAMLDSVVKNYNVFFTGENHLFRKSNYMLQLKMLKYLHKNAGVRHLFLEFGYSRGWLVNKYVHTGDSTLFNILRDYSFEEYALLYKGIYEFNQTLDSADRIIVSGIDIERSFSTPLKVMSMMLPEKEAPRIIALQIEAIRALSKMNDEKQKKSKQRETGDEEERAFYTPTFSDKRSVAYILQNYDSNKVVYQQYLGDAFLDFSRIVEGLRAETYRDEYTDNKAVQEYIFRERFLYDRFVELVNQYPNDKFYSQFGRCHTPLEEQDQACGYYYFKTLSSRINKSDNPHLKNKVLAIAAYYPESSTYEQKVATDEKIDPFLNRAEEEGLTIFRIGSDTALYGKFTEKYQFIIINKNDYRTDIVTIKKDEEEEEFEFDDEYEYEPFFVYAEARRGIYGISLGTLNSNLVLAKGTEQPFTSPVYFWGGAFTSIQNWGSYTSLSFDLFDAQKIAPSDTVRLELHGWSARFRGGFDVIGSAAVHLSPFMGYGFSVLKLTETIESPSTSSGSIFDMSYASQRKWKNPAPFIEGGLDLRLNLRFISVGINGAYMLDLSGKHWRTEGKPDAYSPKTSLSGYYVSLVAALFIGG
jgi:hypothetical protein